MTTNNEELEHDDYDYDDGGDVWATCIDETYICAVTRIRENVGILTIQNQETKEILDEQEVHISYNAMFGPDAFDISTWVETCLNVIDNQKQSEK